MQKALMLGAGTAPPIRRIKGPDSAPEEETKWTTLDISPTANPDYVFDLNNLEHGHELPPRKDHEPRGPYDEIHVYDILEHYGQQGNYHGFF